MKLFHCVGEEEGYWKKINFSINNFSRSGTRKISVQGPHFLSPALDILPNVKKQYSAIHEFGKEKLTERVFNSKRDMSYNVILRNTEVIAKRVEEYAKEKIQLWTRCPEAKTLKFKRGKKVLRWKIIRQKLVTL